MVIEIASQEDLGTLVNGYPKLYILTTAIQKLNKWASAQPKKLHRDCSADVYKLQLLLENSLNALSLQEGQERFQICTRCEAKFDGTSRRGCGKHSSYYVGGTIIAGRWVCCNQTDKNGAGCQAAEHTIEKRKWKQITGYDGCHQWRPA